MEMDVTLVDYHELIVKNLIHFSIQTAKNRLNHDNIMRKLSPNCYCLNAGSHFPLCNGIFDFKFNEAGVEKQLRESINTFKELNLPFAWWWLEKRTIPKSVEDQLIKLGFSSAGQYSGVMCEVDRVAFSEKYSNDINVRKVETYEDHDAHSNILSETFQLQEPIRTEFKLMFNPCSGNTSLTYYVGYYQNEPVSVLTMFIEKNIVGLYAGATLPKARKNGVATALIETALRAAESKGCTIAVAQLMAGNMAAGILKRLGFNTVSHFIPYIHGTSADNLEPKSR